MNWKEKRGKYQAESTDGQIDWLVLPKKNGKYFIKAYLGGGDEYRLPYQEFDSAAEAMAWADNHEKERHAQNAKYRDEKPIRF